MALSNIPRFAAIAPGDRRSQDATVISLYPHVPEYAPSVSPAWLDQRFSSLLGRFEEAIAANKESEAIGAITSRFDQLEERLEKSLGDLAQANEPANLQEIELCIAELANQFETTTAEISRLQSIESQLLEIKNLIDVGGENGAALGAEIDTDQLVDQLATRLADISSQAVTGGAGEETNTEGMKTLIEDFMTDQRDEGEQTAVMLGAMQKAMIRMLDRMEALEETSRKTHAASEASREAALAINETMAEEQVATRDLDGALGDDAAANQPAVMTADVRPDKDSGDIEPSQKVVGDQGGKADSIKSSSQLVAEMRQKSTIAALGEGEPRPDADAQCANVQDVAGEDNAQLDGIDEHDADDIDDADLNEKMESLNAALAAQSKAHKSFVRTRLVVAAVAILAVGLGATKFVMDRSGDDARRHLLSAGGTMSSETVKASTHASVPNAGGVSAGTDEAPGRAKSSHFDY